MEKDLDPDIIKATQVSLGKYVKRPPLSEKLLKKPPFRFLHDVITSVLKTTGFFENLFEEEELVSDNVKDRENKISFLNKVIFVVSTTTGKTLSVKSSKIVAGQEPEKTNELLQVLAHALDKKLSSEDAVKKYRDSVKSSKTTEVKNKERTKATKKGDPKKLTSRSNEKLTSQKSEVSVRSTTKQDKDKLNDSKSKKKEPTSTNLKFESQKKVTQPKVDSKKSVVDKGQKKENRDRSSDRNIKSITGNKQKNDSLNSPKLKRERTSLDETTESNINTIKDPKIVTANGQESLKSAEANEHNLNDSYTIAENDLDSSASSRDLLEVVNVIEKRNNSVDLVMDSVIEPEVIPQKQPQTLEQSRVIQNDKEPRTKDEIQSVSENKIENVQTVGSNDTNDTQVKTVIRPQSVRPSSSRPGAPRMRDKLDIVMKEPENLLLGKVNIIVENTQNEEEEDSSLIIVNNQGEDTSLENNPELQTSSNEHGHLVQQILQSQKELSQATGKTEIEWQFGAQKAREAVNQEIEQLRFSIQALSRVANPLGKLLDHIQEDVEVMRQELQQWTTIYDDVTKEMLKQKTLNEDSLIPLHTKLKQLDGDIDEKHGKINDLKVLIHKNASRIEKLLASGTVQ